MSSEEKIIEFIKRNGPSLPAQVAKEFGLDVFTASAMLYEIRNSKRIKSTVKPIGSSGLYYMPEQETAAKNIIFNKLNDIEKRFVKMMSEHKIALEKDLGPQELFLAKKLGDFVKKTEIDGQVVWHFVTLPEEDVKRLLENRKKPILHNAERQPFHDSVPIEASPPQDRTITGKKVEAVQPVAEEIQKPIQTVAEGPKDPKEEKDFSKTVKEFFKSKNAKIVEEKGRKSQKTYVIEMDSPVGKQEFFVGALDKKKVSESDLSLLWLKAQKKKMPVIVLTRSELSKKCGNFARKEFGNLMKIIRL